MNFEHPHRRLNLLTGEWLVVSPHRTKRPWQGQVEKTAETTLSSYDPDCYLCPENKRSGGVVNPDYPSVFVFDNDFAALYPDLEKSEIDDNGLLMAESERGICRVICFSPNHGLTLAKMEPAEIERVVATWRAQTADLRQNDFIRSVQIFENRGEMMGSSNPHPHGQIWASESVPNELGKELGSFAAHREKHASCLLCDYLKLELEKDVRIVAQNDGFAVLVPFWAIYPFETLIVSKRHFGDFTEFDENESFALAEILKEITSRYDRVFNVSFPYSMGFHQNAFNTSERVDFHFHAHFYPPLLRSATIRKFLVGFELLGSPQRDITPEYAAARLRELGE